MKDYKIGDTATLPTDQTDYLGRYSGTNVTITKIDRDIFTCQGYDGFTFSFPKSFLDFEEAKISSYDCVCGAHVTWGKDCPKFFHHGRCSLFKNKE